MSSTTPQASVPLGRSRDLHALGRELDTLRSEIELLKTQRGVVSMPVQADINSSNGFFVGSFGEAIYRLIDVPRGYTQCNILLFCSAGQTLSGTSNGNVGVWPVVDGVYTGPPISNGVTGGGPVSVSTFFAVNRTGLAPGSQIRLAAWVSNNGPINATSANVHLSASLLFLR